MIGKPGEEPTQRRSERRTSVAALTDIGPREVNEDRMFTALADDGAWVIAVADGLGGHERGDEAAQASVEGLPERVESDADMAVAFAEANERVVGVSGFSRTQRLRVPVREIPMSTLCVAAWTPEGGLLVGWMGDTIPFVVRSGPDGFTGYCCGLPHRDPFERITACLGMLPEDDGFGDGFLELDMVGGFEDSEMPDAVIITSDGAWEPLARAGDEAGWLWDDSPAGIGSACAPDADDASDIARSVLARARSLGLHDNATVSVAYRCQSDR